MIDWIRHLLALRRYRHEPVVNAYLNQRAKRPRAGQLWEPLRFVVLDTETTGLHPQRDAILSLGAVIVQAGKIPLAETLELRFQASPAADQETISVHGITPAESREGMAEREALLETLAFLGNAVLVGHHVHFDARILEHRLQVWFPGLFLFNPLVDTAQLAMRVEHPGKDLSQIKAADYGLDALCARFDIRKTDRHTAPGDAYLTGILLLKLLHRMNRTQRISLRSLLAE